MLASQIIEEKCIQQLIINQKYWEFTRKGTRGQSLVTKFEKVTGQSLFVPRERSRKNTLPEKY